MSTAPQTPARRQDAVGHLPHTLCLAALNQLVEPNDVTAAALLELMTPAELLALIRREDHVPLDLGLKLAEATGRQPAPNSAQDLRVALTRWRKRLPYANEHAALQAMQRLGGGLLTNQDPGWPAQLDDLGLGRPLCLWWRAADPGNLGGDRERTVSIVGSRDASDYGNQVTFELAPALGCRASRSSRRRLRDRHVSPPRRAVPRRLGVPEPADRHDPRRRSGPALPGRKPQPAGAGHRPRRCTPRCRRAPRPPASAS